MSSPVSVYQSLAEEIIREVKSDTCIKLEYEKLAALLELVLDNPEVIDILRKTPILRQETLEGIICFETAYQIHIIEGKKEFILMTFMHSFALSWLFHLYH